MSAGIYLRRQKLDTVLITEFFGGQLGDTSVIENYPGFKRVAALDLVKKFKNHLLAYKPYIIEGEKAVGLKRKKGAFEVFLGSGERVSSRAVVVATGARHRRLDVPGEDKFQGRGVSFCATCDAPLFADKNVAVIGGGNSALSAARDLIPYASKIYLLNIQDSFRGEKILLEQVLKSSKVRPILNAQTQKITGGEFVQGLDYLDLKSGKKKTISVGGVFVEIGLLPNSQFLEGILELDGRGQIIVSPEDNSTALAGVFAAGDVTNSRFKQIIIAAASGAKAALGTVEYLSRL